MAIPSQGSIPSPIGRLLAWAFVLVLVAAVASQVLSGSDDEVRVPTTTLSPATTTTTMPPAFWMNKYEWTLKDHIDALVVQEDCTELHDRYVKATLANAAVTQRYGTGTADLLEYIFLASDAVGCYD
jgi:FlaG/FlaF family flagellin (archaellin)